MEGKHLILKAWPIVRVCFALVVVLPASPQAVTGSPELVRKIESLLHSSPSVARGRLGFKFVDVATGRVLAEQNASRFFTPASNAKLYTTALALARLGAAYQFHTQLRTTGTWNPGQHTIPDLQLIGGGDPNLSGRTLPYLVDQPEGDSLAAIKQLADTVVDAGIQSIAGDITGVAGRYGRETYPDGWTLDDSIYSYGAPVSALSLNDNTISVIVRPTETGELADVELRPGFVHLIVNDQVTTDESSMAHVQLNRPPGSNELTLSGTIGTHLGQWREDTGVDDGALFAAEALTDVLRQRGIRVAGVPRASYEQVEPFGTLIGEKLSQPLIEDLQIVNKVSQNLHAEMLLREVAKVRTGTGSLKDGRAERDLFLQEAGITRDGTGYVLDDGSGLARQDLITPESTVTLLRFMWARPNRDLWLNTLPIGGVDGSLQHRFQKIAGAERVHAKTGSLSHVNSLGGYIETRDHRHIAFSILVNGTAGHESDVREFTDRLCSLFLSL